MSQCSLAPSVLATQTGMPTHAQAHLSIQAILSKPSYIQNVNYLETCWGWLGSMLPIHGVHLITPWREGTRPRMSITCAGVPERVIVKRFSAYWMHSNWKTVDFYRIAYEGRIKVRNVFNSPKERHRIILHESWHPSLLIIHMPNPIPWEGRLGVG